MENQPVPMQEKSPTESGYSETEQAKVIEGSQVDAKQLKKRKPVSLGERKNKILSAYQSIQSKLLDLVRNLNESGDNMRHQDRIVEEIHVLQSIQAELVQCLLLEQRGELSESTASNRAWDLIK